MYVCMYACMCVKINFNEFINIYLFFLIFVSIVVKTTEHEEECHIVNLLLFKLKIISSL